MFTPRFIPLLAGLTMLCLGSVASAQSQSSAASDKRTFSLIALSELPYKNLYYRSSKGFVPIELRKRRRSDAYPLSAVEFLELYTDHSDPEQQYRLIGQGKLVKQSKRMLFFLKNIGGQHRGRLPVLVLGLDDSHNTFPNSSFRFINFISKPLVIEFNRERFQMQPGESKISKLDLPAGGDFTPFVVKDTEGKRLAGTRLFSHAKGREMVLLFPPKEGKKRLNIEFFSD